MDAYEQRSELAIINLIQDTKYKPTNYNISFNYLDNPQLSKRLEEGQRRIQFNINTHMVPAYGRIVYDCTKPTWIPTAATNPQSQCLKERKNKIE